MNLKGLYVEVGINEDIPEEEIEEEDRLRMSEVIYLFIY